ncbi:putative late blight resistance protein -like protein R1B-16-like [Capsicum annuum]|nr:putative late blight resistance protein -like protein R1B-16-like [Capsicum annuum]
MGKTAKKLKEGLIDDDECSYSSELDDVIEKNLMFKVMVKEFNIIKQDEVYKVVKFADDEALFKEYRHPSLKYTESLFEGTQNKGGDELFEVTALHVAIVQDPTKKSLHIIYSWMDRKAISPSRVHYIEGFK